MSGIEPTATHQLGDRHETADSWPYGNAGTGIDPSDQLEAAASLAPAQSPTITHSAATGVATRPAAPRTIGGSAPIPPRRATSSGNLLNTRANTDPTPTVNNY